MKFLRYLFMISSLSVVGCSSYNHVKGINIGVTLYENSTYAEQALLKKKIQGSLNGNANDFIDLINIDCGGGSGCYDLGDVLTQIIFKIGEDKTIVMMNSATNADKQALKGFIEVGLAYGSSNPKKQTIKDVFPKIDVFLNKKND